MNVEVGRAIGIRYATTAPPPWGLMNAAPPCPSSEKKSCVPPVAKSKVGPSQSPSPGGPHPNFDSYTIRIGLLGGTLVQHWRPSDLGLDSSKAVDPGNRGRPIGTGDDLPRGGRIQLLVRQRRSTGRKETILILTNRLTFIRDKCTPTERAALTRLRTQQTRQSWCRAPMATMVTAVIGLRCEEAAVEVHGLRDVCARAYRVRKLRGGEHWV